MADAEESPSSLAELEALAGLESPATSATDESSADADTRDFDLASLAATTVVGAPARDELTDDAPLELKGLVVQSGATAARSVGATAAETATPIAATTEPSVAATSASTASPSPGFATGMLAGVAIAGVLAVVAFVVMSRAPADPSQRAATPPARVDAPASMAARAGAAAAQAPERQVPPVAPTPGVSSATPPVAVTTSARPTAKTSAAARPASTNAPTESAATPSVAASAPSADPTRPPDAPPSVVAASDAPARPIDTLLDDALGSRKPSKQAKTRADDLMGDELPLTPTAADVTQVVQVLLPAIRGCAMGQSGVANTLLVVRSDGGVASASITGAPFAGVASGRCMEGVLRRAKFPRFRQSVFRVQFPLSIRGGT